MKTRVTDMLGIRYPIVQGGDIESGLVWAGQVVGLIDDIPTCEELISRMVRECRERLAIAQRLAA